MEIGSMPVWAIYIIVSIIIGFAGASYDKYRTPKVTKCMYLPWKAWFIEGIMLSIFWIPFLLVLLVLMLADLYVHRFFK